MAKAGLLSSSSEQLAWFSCAGGGLVGVPWVKGRTAFSVVHLLCSCVLDGVACSPSTLIPFVGLDCFGPCLTS